jgi:hypothetical protein
MSLRGLVLVLLLGAVCAIASSSAVSAAPSPLARRASHSHNVAGETRTAASSSAASAASAKAAAAANSPEAPTGLGQAQPGPSAAGGASAPSSPGPSSGIGTGIATTAVQPAPPAWLDEINRYRAGAGLDPVSDQPSWDAGIVAHLTYVAKTPKGQVIGPYASLHTENPASSFFTPDGSREASRSDLFFGASDLSPVEFIDGWFSAPFHAIGMLRARLTQVAFADQGGDAAGLDVIGGLDDDAPPRTAPILFPGDGMTTNITSYTGGESPNPLESCGWTDNGSGYGVPLIALLSSAPRAGLSAQVVAADGTVLSTANGQLCAVDELTYHSSDPVYGQTGQQILRDDHAVLLIARPRYQAGGYTATISQPGRGPITWSFTVRP